ncbi:MAG: RagB/SusD family nutrient uptake outer membrane protein [Allomuricauda sp.]
MKKLYKLILTCAAVLNFGCSEEDIIRVPLDEFSASTAFSTYSSVQTYSWRFYAQLRRRPNNINGSLLTNTDMMMNGRSPNGDNWLWQRIIVPAESGNWSTPYQRIRDINIMLDNLGSEGSSLTEEEVNHWRSVGLFFRSLNYIQLVSQYGDVPWVDREIGAEDTDILFGPRTPRNEVTQKIVNDLLFAEANINPDGDGPNTINTHVVRALISRFGLFEGTWRKYHDLGGEDTYLQACVNASEKLMEDFPSLIPDYYLVHHSEDLSNAPGMILYFNFLFGQVTHSIHHFNRSSENPRIDLTKAAADAFLLSDGRPRSTSPLFEGDQDPYDEFRNRDYRMYFTITPPYEVVGNIGGNISAWEHTGDPAHREYMDLMETIADERIHLPELNWAGFVQPIAPNWLYAGNPNGVAFDPGYNVTGTGYKSYKWYNKLKIGERNVDETDEPIFRMGEILLNYAEAKFELGEFDQSVADMTINKLRERGNVAPMIVGSIDAGWDTDRDPDVEPVLWEIRRERAVELMVEGFRFNDLRRWRKMNYATQKKLGRWVDSADLNAPLPIEGGAAAGYVSRKENDATPPPFPDHYYLFPIPSNEIVLNPQLEQNPGW